MPGLLPQVPGVHLRQLRGPGGREVPLLLPQQAGEGGQEPPVGQRQGGLSAQGQAGPSCSLRWQI